MKNPLLGHDNLTMSYKQSYLHGSRDDWEELEKWRDILTDIPYLNFPSELRVRMVPPFGGAVARFHAKLKGAPETTRISVYLDWYDCAGYMGEPYWEIHPNPEGDCSRFRLYDTEELVLAILEAATYSAAAEKGDTT